MSQAATPKPNRILQTLRRYFLSQLNRLMQWDMHQIDDREYRRRL